MVLSIIIFIIAYNSKFCCNQHNLVPLTIDYNIKDIDLVANGIFQNLESKTIVFNGEMGSGKTTLIKALAKVLGCNDEVKSPTFSIVNEYKLNDKNIYHFDLYRIKTEEELMDIGFEDYFYHDNWIFIEWPERAEGLIPHKFDTIEIKIKSNFSRIIMLNPNTNKTEQKL